LETGEFLVFVLWEVAASFRQSQSSEATLEGEVSIAGAKETTRIALFASEVYQLWLTLVKVALLSLSLSIANLNSTLHQGDLHVEATLLPSHTPIDDYSSRKHILPGLKCFQSGAERINEQFVRVGIVTLAVESTQVLVYAGNEGESLCADKAYHQSGPLSQQRQFLRDEALTTCSQ
jgi:hypothetical protein